MRKLGRAFARLILIALWAAALSAFAQTYTVTDLPFEEAKGINNFGQVVGRSFLWTPTSQNATTGSLIDFGTYISVAINGPGQVLLNSRPSLLWTPSSPNGTNGTANELKSPGSTVASGALGLNDAGVVVGVAEGKADPHCTEVCPRPPYPATWIALQGHLLDHDLGYATGINGSGHVIGTKFWQPDGTATQLTPSPPDVPIGINDFGQVIGSYGSYSPIYAFLWTPSTPNSTTGQLTDLGSLGGQVNGGQLSRAYGINGRGQVVGFSVTTGGDGHGFIWFPSSPNGTQGTMTDLNTLIPPESGWVLGAAFAVNDFGQVVGQGLNPSGLYHAYLLTPVSSPRLSSPSIQPGGQFGFTLIGEAGRSYTIQASTNLVDWTALTNFVSANGTNQFTDATAPNFSRRFYRALIQ